MTSPLTFTGERFVPEVSGAIWYEHWHRYSLVAPLVRGRTVLDAACGEGYGSMLLAREAESVTGIDIDAAAVAHASRRYAANGRLRYVQASCTRLPLADASVDVIVSFETIEHLAEQDDMLAEFRRVLRPDGCLLLSSPNKPVYSSVPDENNHYHVRELDRAELAALLDRHFPAQAWYGQRVLAHSLIWSETRLAQEAAQLSALASDEVRMLASPAPPMYFLVVCGSDAARLPSLPGLSLFDDGEQSLYADYQRVRIEAQRLFWDVANERKIADERLQQAIAAVNDLAGAREREQALALRVTDLEAELQGLREALSRTHAELAELARHQRVLEARIAYRESVVGWMRWPLGRIRLAMSQGRAS